MVAISHLFPSEELLVGKWRPQETVSLIIAATSSLESYFLLSIILRQEALYVSSFHFF
jgi:hypothetical protein